jgi:cyclophilin family peptidyl-prolyl cis-trans isomerase
MLFSRRHLSHVRVLSLSFPAANTGTPESGGSQFFINVRGKKKLVEVNVCLNDCY